VIAKFWGKIGARRAALVTVGFLVIGVAVAVAGSKTWMLVAGSALVVAGSFLPRLTLTGVELGFGPVKATLAAQDDEFRRAFQERAERFQRFAWLVCGDADEARGLVEEALAEARLQQRTQPIDKCIRYALCTLLDRLETAPDRRLLDGLFGAAPKPRGHAGESLRLEDRDRATMAALAGLPVGRRTAYLVRVFFGLPESEVAELVRRPLPEVHDDIVRAQRALEVLQPQPGGA
jgi:DNA-directed RNA polymerase specialized sigma24 family protein